MPFILPIFRLGSVLQLESEPEVTQIGEAPKQKPFWIPEKWKWVYLSELVISRDGERRPVKKSDREKKEKIFDYYGATGVIDKIDSYLFDETLLLVGEDGANLLSRARDNAFIASGKYWVNNHAHVLEPKKMLVDIEYLQRYLNSISLAKYVSGSAQPKLTQKNMMQILVPLPSLSEQCRISRKVKQLFEQIDFAEKAYNELSGPLSERFRQLCLEKAIQGKLVPQLESEPEVEQVGDAPEDVPFAIPEKWKWVNLHSTLKAISDGSHNPPPNVGHGVPVLSAKNVINGIIDTNSVTRWTTEEQWSIEDKKIHIQSGDVLLTIVGTIGRTAVVPNDCEKFMLQRSVCVMKPKECVNPEFLALILNSPSLFEWIMDHASGTAQKGIYLKTVKQIPIPLPSIEEQRRIVAKLNELLGSISQLEQTISTP